MKVFSLMVVAAALAGISCERHEFDGPNGTKQLHHSDSGHGHDAGHDAGPAEDDKGNAH